MKMFARVEDKNFIALNSKREGPPKTEPHMYPQGFYVCFYF